MLHKIVCIKGEIIETSRLGECPEWMEGNNKNKFPRTYERKRAGGRAYESTLSILHNLSLLYSRRAHLHVSALYMGLLSFVLFTNINGRVDAVRRSFEWKLMLHGEKLKRQFWEKIIIYNYFSWQHNKTFQEN